MAFKHKFGEEEREFETIDDLVNVVREEERTSAATELQEHEKIKGEYDAMSHFFRNVPEAQQILDKMWRETDGGTKPLPAGAPPAGSADPALSFLSFLDSADVKEDVPAALRDGIRQVILAQKERADALEGQIGEIQKKYLPLVIDLATDQQARIAEKKFNDGISKMRKEFTSVPDDAWATILETAEEAEVPVSKMLTVIEKQVKALSKHFSGTPGSAPAGSAAPNLAGLPGGLPAPRGGSPAVGGGVDDGIPKTREELRARLVAAMGGGAASGTADGV